jgi:hypothetical protein
VPGRCAPGHRAHPGMSRDRVRPAHDRYRNLIKPSRHARERRNTCGFPGFAAVFCSSSSMFVLFFPGCCGPARIAAAAVMPGPPARADALAGRNADQRRERRGAVRALQREGGARGRERSAGGFGGAGTRPGAERPETRNGVQERKKPPGGGRPTDTPGKREGVALHPAPRFPGAGGRARFITHTCLGLSVWTRKGWRCGAHPLSVQPLSGGLACAVHGWECKNEF